MQIRITKLKKGWLIENLWNKPKTFSKAITVYRKVENKLMSLPKNLVVSIAINFHDTYLNSRRKPQYDQETIEASLSELNTIMYAFTVFMEDVLLPDFINSRIERYLTRSDSSFEGVK